jgi:hypothetical protein
MMWRVWRRSPEDVGMAGGRKPIWNEGAVSAAVSADLDALCINTTRFLSIDAVQQANSGHQGLPMAFDRGQVPAEQAVIDDLAMSVAVARRLGMDATPHRSLETTRDALAQRGPALPRAASKSRPLQTPIGTHEGKRAAWIHRFVTSEWSVSASWAAIWR